MAIALMMEFKGGTAEQYDAVIESLDLGGRLARGGIFHAGGTTEDGIRIIDVWESKEAVDTFVQERLGPVSQRLNIPPPEVTVWPVRHMLTEKYAG